MEMNLKTFNQLWEALENSTEKKYFYICCNIADGYIGILDESKPLGELYKVNLTQALKYLQRLTSAPEEGYEQIMRSREDNDFGFIPLSYDRTFIVVGPGSLWYSFLEDFQAGRHTQDTWDFICREKWNKIFGEVVKLREKLLHVKKIHPLVRNQRALTNKYGTELEDI